MTRHHLPLKLVLTITYLLYFRLLLFIDTGFIPELPGVINSLNKFIKEHEQKIHDFGLGINLFNF